jgi:hypothetical protein
MKKLLFFGLLFLALFEIANVYFIMPMPGSQEMNSIDVAYFLYTLRWVFRGLFGLMILYSFVMLWPNRRKWLRILALLPTLAIVYLFNFVMVADRMFLQPSELILKNAADNNVPLDRLIIGIEHNGEAKAYPVEFLAYHHQVQDSIGGKPVIVTYCNVCRTGRVFEPLVNGKPEKFRLVGMDHFNAMFEDEATGSWWRQVNGEAITGDHKGKVLPEFHSVQVSLSQWFALHPHSLVMQEDPAAVQHYDSEARYEKGDYSGGLTGTDKESWATKSWVVGIQVGTASKAYDWNELLVQRVINDQVGETPIVLVVADDNQSFAAFERPADVLVTIKGDTLSDGVTHYNFYGSAISGNTSLRLDPVPAYQEFWHSWRTFHPGTERYE